MTRSSSQSPAKPALLVFGLDQAGKAKAGRFPERHAVAARKAAKSLNLTVRVVDRPEIEAIAKQIPVGRLHSQGKAFLPYVKRDLFDRLQSVLSTPHTATVKRAAAKAQADHLQSGVPQAPEVPARRLFIVLGFDKDRKPCGAKFADPDLDSLTKTAARTGLNLYELKSRRLAHLVAGLPKGQLTGNGQGFAPSISQDLYSQIISEIAAAPKVIARGKVNDPLPPSKGQPETWDKIATGHLVIAQETLDYGWAEAIVVDRHDDVLTLRYRDYPIVPKFYRPLHSVALLYQSSTKA